jgi:hypothetical protein
MLADHVAFWQTGLGQAAMLVATSGILAWLTGMYRLQKRLVNSSERNERLLTGSPDDPEGPNTSGHNYRLRKLESERAADKIEEQARHDWILQALEAGSRRFNRIDDHIGIKTGT